MKRKNMLAMIVFALLAVNILTVLYMQIELSSLTQQQNPTALAFGSTYICLNHAPDNISEGSCNFTMPWGIPINCTVNSTDPDNDSVYYQGYFITNESLFNISLGGAVNVNLNKTSIGNHTFRIIVADQSGCSNNFYTEDFPIEVIDINHAPYLSAIIPNSSLRWETAYAFFLDDYFSDIDGDNLTYMVVTDNNFTLINIVDDSSLTTIRGLECGVSHFYFIASDPDGLTATSNYVTYTITDCPIDSGSSGGSSGGGGGGGNSYSCTPDWRCSAWSACQENGTRTLRCIDYNGCNAYDYINYFTENCTYITPEYKCDEKWECNDWSTCIDGTHTRKCIDKNSCGTEIDKPEQNESCKPIPSCFNGIQDGDETGVDCGGSCGRCAVTEQPAETTGIDSRIWIAIIITLATLILVAVALRKQLKQLWKYILEYNKKKKQPTYLKEPQKLKILNLAFNLQDRFKSGEHMDLQKEVKPIRDLYFMELLGLDIPAKITGSLHKLNNKQLESMLADFYKRTSSLEKYGKAKTQEMIDEIFDHIYLVSEFHEKDALVLDKERASEVEDPLDVFYQKLSNLHIAMEFREMNEAKNLYNELLEDYNKLEHSKKTLVYDDMMIIYNIILYMERFY